ncbi:hypothetical protein PMM47T1_12643 [Pseudomonas sp. M47T1]|uniref:thioredoxin family protein n=1 Tax=unclassified Pseudomonas TaxID=196821 RepID=UPI0002607282|nr:thioredoxin family protein [Pseudomonas sp. M47T1]EIK96139.1 hypothetical protein PMM47T1_12643 [Pseudomonas sp. M47T1]
MASYSQLSDIGQRFDAFVATGLEGEADTVHRAQQVLEADGVSERTLQRLSAIKGSYRLLAAGEMWCPDCQLNLAALDYLCRLQPRVQLAVVSKARAEHDLRERLGLDKVSIPLVVVMDCAFEPIGLFVERPRAVVEGSAEVLAAYKAGQCLEATISDVLALIENAEKHQ